MRCIAILLVVLNHVSNWEQFYNPNQLVKNVYMSIATTGVPVFIMISGALLLSKHNEPISAFFKKRMNKILVPFACWSYIYLVYQKYVPLLPWQRTIPASSVSFNPIILLKGPTYAHLWFIYMLICLYLTVPILRKLCANIPKNLLHYMMAILIIGTTQQFINTVLGKSIISPMLNLNFMMDYTVYLFIGFIFIQSDYTKKLTGGRSVIFIIIGMVITILLANGFSSKGSSSELFWSGNSPFVMITSLGVFGLIMNIDIPNKFNKAIKSISDASFGIFFIHFIILYLLTLMKISSKSLFALGHHALVIPILSVTCFIASYFAVTIIKHIPIIRKIV
jgi:surface polysaccharide O-acyltransferase-like enzyme